MQYFLSNDIEQCRNEYEQVKTLQVAEEKNPSCLIHYFVPTIIYQSVFEHKLQDDILAEIHRTADRLLKSDAQPRNKLPMFEIETIDALHYAKMHKEILNLADHTFKNYDLTDWQSSIFYQLFLSVYASSLLATGEDEKAFEYYKQVKYQDLNFPSHMKFYIKIRLLLVKTEFLIKKGNHKKALKILKKIKIISENLRFTYFYDQASSIETKLDPKQSK